MRRSKVSSPLFSLCLNRPCTMPAIGEWLGGVSSSVRPSLPASSPGVAAATDRSSSLSIDSIPCRSLLLPVSARCRCCCVAVLVWRVSRPAPIDVSAAQKAARASKISRFNYAAIAVATLSVLLTSAYKKTGQNTTQQQQRRDNRQRPPAISCSRFGFSLQSNGHSRGGGSGGTQSSSFVCRQERANLPLPLPVLHAGPSCSDIAPARARKELRIRRQRARTSTREERTTQEADDRPCCWLSL